MGLKPANYAELVLILFGIFLVIDSLFLHLLTLAYPPQIKWLDGIINHWMVGLAFIAIGIYGLGRGRGKNALKKYWPLIAIVLAEKGHWLRRF